MRYAIKQLKLSVSIGLILIFGKQKRCLHDCIAGTKVVNL